VVGSTRVWIQDLTLAREALFSHWAMPPSPYCHLIDEVMESRKLITCPKGLKKGIKQLHKAEVFVYWISIFFPIGPHHSFWLFFCFTKIATAGCLWLVPATLAPWEAEIRRIAAWCQSGQTVLETSSPKWPEQKGLEVWHSGRVLALQVWSPKWKPQSH
jgi:hypothetical protein